jgi:hypothetical protein
MATSEKKIAANRANAKKSTGPKTSRGKGYSSRNGIRHGLLASVTLIEGESRERFVELCKAFEAEFQPETPTERALVSSATSSRWRLTRLWAMETAGMIYEQRHEADSPETADPATRTMLAFRSLNDNARNAEIMARYESLLDRQYHRAIDRLSQTRDAKIVRATQSQQLRQNRASTP